MDRLREETGKIKKGLVEDSLSLKKLYYVPFFQSSKSVQELVSFLSCQVQGVHHIFNGHLGLAKVLVTLVEVFDDGSLELSAAPSRVADQNDDCPHKCLLVGLPFRQNSTCPQLINEPIVFKGLYLLTFHTTQTYIPRL